MHVTAYYLPVLKSAKSVEDIKAWQEGGHAREYGRDATEYEISVATDRLTDERGREYPPTAIHCTFGRWFDDGRFPPVSLNGELELKSSAAVRWLGHALVEAANALEKGERVSRRSPLFRES